MKLYGVDFYEKKENEESLIASYNLTEDDVNSIKERCPYLVIDINDLKVTIKGDKFDYARALEQAKGKGYRITISLIVQALNPNTLII